MGLACLVWLRAEVSENMVTVPIPRLVKTQELDMLNYLAVGARDWLRLDQENIKSGTSKENAKYSESTKITKGRPESFIRRQFATARCCAPTSWCIDLMKPLVNRASRL